MLKVITCVLVIIYLTLVSLMFFTSLIIAIMKDWWEPYQNKKAEKKWRDELNKIYCPMKNFPGVSIDCNANECPHLDCKHHIKNKNLC